MKLGIWLYGGNDGAKTNVRITQYTVLYISIDLEIGDQKLKYAFIMFIS